MEDAPSLRLLLCTVLVWTGFLYEANRIRRYLRGVG